MNKKIFIASDHAGYEMKTKLNEYFNSFIDLGTNSFDSVDYPDFAHKLTSEVLKNVGSLGILICGTGNGINMSANKHQGIRAALCWNIHIAEQARLHNNANILTMPARHLSWQEVKKIVETFLYTNFEGGRHEKRVNKIKLKKK